MALILRIAVPKPIRAVFDYLLPESMDGTVPPAGVRVRVPFGRTECVGYLLGTAEGSAIATGQLRQALGFIDNEPLLGVEEWELLRWAARYYHHPVGEVIATGYPQLLRQGGRADGAICRSLQLTTRGLHADAASLARAPRQAQLLEMLKSLPGGMAETELAELSWDWRGPAKQLLGRGWAELCLDRCSTADLAPPDKVEPALALNEDQRLAVERIVASIGSREAFLLEGVTGSGKTEVYLQAVDKVLAQGKQVMVLLPEIALTPQLESRFRARVGARLRIFHSEMSEIARRDSWLAMRDHTASVLLGTRSAVFTPMRDPGLIVVDEEHDQSYKQQDGFRYSARDIAVMRALRLGIPIVLGSATPSLESLANVDRKRYCHLGLPTRAGGSLPPRFSVIDIRGKNLAGGLSDRLLSLVSEAIGRREQALLFLNRRGYAPTLICHACGWMADCPHCDAHLVVHRLDKRLRCHHCGLERQEFRACPACGSDDLRPLGLGTERIENVLQELFPAATIARIDRDSTRRKGSLDRLLEEAREGRIDILLGTQMLAKGHHFPRVTLVGIIDVDASLFSSDFRSSERTAQLIIQVAGRAGREQLPGIVALQTRHPEHPLFIRLLRQGYSSYAKTVLMERRASGLPPFSHQVLWHAESKDRDEGLTFLRHLGQQAKAGGEVSILGPVPAPIARKASRYAWQLLLQCADRKPLHDLLAGLVAEAGSLPCAKRTRWSVDVDPLDFS